MEGGEGRERKRGRERAGREGDLGPVRAGALEVESGSHSAKQFDQSACTSAYVCSTFSMYIRALCVHACRSTYVRTCTYMKVCIYVCTYKQLAHLPYKSSGTDFSLKSPPPCPARRHLRPAAAQHAHTDMKSIKPMVFYTVCI